MHVYKDKALLIFNDIRNVVKYKKMKWCEGVSWTYFYEYNARAPGGQNDQPLANIVGK